MYFKGEPGMPGFNGKEGLPGFPGNDVDNQKLIILT